MDKHLKAAVCCGIAVVEFGGLLPSLGYVEADRIPTVQTIATVVETLKDAGHEGLTYNEFFNSKSYYARVPYLSVVVSGTTSNVMSPSLTLT